MTIDAWLRQAKKRIPALDAELLVLMMWEITWGRVEDRSYLAAHRDEEMSSLDLEILTNLMRRRIKKEPLAYILGETEFYGRTFWVTPEVLVPRSETEALIDLVKGLELPRQPRFLEIGTGSGCIAITLALEYPQAKVLATDISRQALDIAEQNDVIHEGRAEFLRADLIKDLVDQVEDLEFDVVVANLPYVDPDWTWIDKEALKYEPKIALYVKKEGGLGLYRRFFEELEEISTRYVVVEADVCQHEALKQIAATSGWRCRKTDGYGLLFDQLVS